MIIDKRIQASLLMAIISKLAMKPTTGNAELKRYKPNLILFLTDFPELFKGWTVICLWNNNEFQVKIPIDST